MCNRNQGKVLFSPENTQDANPVSEVLYDAANHPGLSPIITIAELCLDTTQIGESPTLEPNFQLYPRKPRKIGKQRRGGRAPHRVRRQLKRAGRLRRIVI